MFTEKMIIKLTKVQKETLRNYAIQLEIPVSQLVRSAINTYLSTKILKQSNLLNAKQN
jgi:hypothetical protein